MEKFYEQNEQVSKKDWLTSLVLCWFLGFFGVHRMYAGKAASGCMLLFGTVISIGLLFFNKYLGATAFVIVGAFVVNDFLNILLKCFKDVHGKEISSDTVIK